MLVKLLFLTIAIWIPLLAWPLAAVIPKGNSSKLLVNHGYAVSLMVGCIVWRLSWCFKRTIVGFVAVLNFDGTAPNRSVVTGAIQMNGDHVWFINMFHRLDCSFTVITEQKWKIKNPAFINPWSYDGLCHLFSSCLLLSWTPTLGCCIAHFGFTHCDWSVNNSVLYHF